MNLFAPIVMLGIGQSVALACSCFPHSPCFNISSDGLAFVGEATAVHWAFGGEVAVDSAVTEAFGKLSGKKTVTVYTNNDSKACGYPFKVGVAYFVSAGFYDSKPRTSACSGTRPAVVAAAFIRQVRAMQAGQPPALIFGFIEANRTPASRL